MGRNRAPDSVKQARINEAANLLYEENGKIPKQEDVLKAAKMSSRDAPKYYQQWKASQMAVAATVRLTKDTQDGLDKHRADAEQLLKNEVAWLKIRDHEAAIHSLREQYMADVQKISEEFGERVAELETIIEYLQAQLFEYKAENTKLKTELTEARALNISRDVLADILQQLKQPHTQSDVLPVAPVEKSVEKPAEEPPEKDAA